jgi:N-methylhydantoinase B/oxoprolinase/acetone carboxylase alpha subunit
MQEAVQYQVIITQLNFTSTENLQVNFFLEQLKVMKGDLNPGDVILSNHPTAGGSHLPDLTVITPVFLPR